MKGFRVMNPPNFSRDEVEVTILIRGSREETLTKKSTWIKVLLRNVITKKGTWRTEGATGGGGERELNKISFTRNMPISHVQNPKQKPLKESD
jgi:hypothetical protein